MSNRYILYNFLTRFVACLTRLAAAKKIPGGEDFYFYKRPEIPYRPIRLFEIGAENEDQLVVLPGVNKAFPAGHVLKDANELERWLNKRGLSLKDGSFLPNAGPGGDAETGKQARVEYPAAARIG